MVGVPWDRGHHCGYPRAGGLCGAVLGFCGVTGALGAAGGQRRGGDTPGVCPEPPGGAPAQGPVPASAGRAQQAPGDGVTLPAPPRPDTATPHGSDATPGERCCLPGVNKGAARLWCLSLLGETEAGSGFWVPECHIPTCPCQQPRPGWLCAVTLAARSPSPSQVSPCPWGPPVPSLVSPSGAVVSPGSPLHPPPGWGGHSPSCPQPMLSKVSPG